REVQHRHRRRAVWGNTPGTRRSSIDRKGGARSSTVRINGHRLRQCLTAMKPDAITCGEALSTSSGAPGTLSYKTIWVVRFQILIRNRSALGLVRCRASEAVSRNE